MLSYTRSYRVTGVANLLGSLLVAFGLVASGHKFFTGTFQIIWSIGIPLFALFPIINFLRLIRYPLLELRVDNERIELTSPSSDLGDSFSLPLDAVDSVIWEEGSEGEDNWFLLTTNGKRFRLPANHDFPVFQLREHIKLLKSAA